MKLSNKAAISILVFVVILAGIFYLVCNVNPDSEVSTVFSGVLLKLFSLMMSIVSGVLLPYLAAWLKSKTNSVLLNSAIEDLTTTVQTSVNYAEQTIVEKLKANDEWDSDAQKQVLRDVIDNVILNLSATTTKYLEYNESDIYDVVERYIESYIQSKKSK